MADYTVTITVDLDTCTFTYNAAQTVLTKRGKKHKRVAGKKLHVSTNDKVRWTCAAGNFCGVFKSESPLEAAGFAALQGHFSKKLQVTADPKPGGNGPNTYSYSVAVVRASDGKTCTDDPDIIIDA